MERVRLGIAGCGVIGKMHLAAAAQSPLIEIAAVADLRPDAVREAAQRFKVGAVYPSASEMFEDRRIEAVVLAMPACWRTELALQAFARGKHVLTEKPVAMNGDEVRRMIEARGNLVSGCCSSRFRFLPSSQAVADFIATGALGGLRVVRCRAMSAAGPKPETMPPPWRLNKSLNAGGILTNWGCYDMDYLLGITGWSLRPRRVLAQTWSIPPQLRSHVPPGSEADTHFAGIVLCDGGTVITLERGEYAAAGTDGQWQVIGDKGSLQLTMGPAAGKKIVHQYTTEQGLASDTLWEGTEDAGLVHSGPVQDFAAAILEGRQPKTSLEQALVIQAITDAVYASAERGDAVEVRL